MIAYCDSPDCAARVHAKGKCKVHYNLRQRRRTSRAPTIRRIVRKEAEPPVEDYTSVGQRITLLRRERRMKAADLAKKAGISNNTLSYMVWRSKHNVSLFNVELVAQALGVETWELFMDAPLRDESDR